VNPWRGLGGLPREVWLVCASTLVNRLGTMALPFLVLYLTEGRHWTPAEAGYGMMTYGAGALAAGPFSGRLADRLGHAHVLKASLWTSGALLLSLVLKAPSPSRLPHGHPPGRPGGWGTGTPNGSGAIRT
jgi:predicted MFS family arabinose efflux permease